MKQLCGWIGLCLFLGIGLGGCLLDPPQEESLHIVVLGSSTAAGAGPTQPQEAWTARYDRYLQGLNPGNRLTNLAHGGYLSYQLLPTGTIPPPHRPRPDLRRNITRALQLKPDAILVNLPSNDTDAGYRLDEQMHNLRRIASTAQRQGVPVWITTTQPRIFYPWQVEIQEALRDSIQATFTECAIDFWTDLGDCAGWPLLRFDSGDGVHLNGAGHALLFERVKEKGIPEALH